MKTTSWISAIALFTVLLAVPAHAGTEAILAKGFEPNRAYHSGDFDSVNMLNGDLAVNVPIGPTYKTNGTLQYNFNLHHFGTAWAFFDYYAIDSAPTEYRARYNFCCSYAWHLGGPLGYTQHSFAYYNSVAFSLDSPSSAGYAGSEAVPVGNAGMGWHFTTGDFSASPVDEVTFGGGYADSRGGGMSFGTTLHDAGAAGTPGVAYSQDGSYARLRKIGNDTLVRQVEFADGTVERFQCVDRCDHWSAEWHLQWKADPYGNVLLVERSPALRPPNGGDWVWTYIEGTLPDGEAGAGPRYYTASDRASLKEVRKHRVTFTNDNRFPGHPLLSERLKSIELAGPGGDFSLFYNFVYAKKDILRTTVRPWRKGSLFYPYNSDKTIKVDVLDHIQLPAGGGTWKFTYHRGSGTDGDNIGYTYCGDASAPSTGCNGEDQYPTSLKAGRLETVRAPTGGGYKYDYGTRVIPKARCKIARVDDGDYGGGSLLALKSRTEIDAAGTEVKRFTEEKPGVTPEKALVRWLYAGSAYFRAFVDANGDGNDDGNGTAICRAPEEFIGAMLDPNGLLTLSYYNAEVQPEGFRASYGAPYSGDASRDDTVTRWNGQSVTRPLSSETYQIDDMSDTSPWVVDLRDAVRRLSRQYRKPGETPHAATRLRSTYATYEWSDEQCIDLSTSDCQPLNLRMTSMHMRYHDDGIDQANCDVNGKPVTESFVEQVFSDFDGLGHFRQQHTFGNTRAVGVGSPGAGDWDHRADYTRYNGDTPYGGEPMPAAAPAPSAPWLIGLYTRRSVIEGKTINTTLYGFDPGRGFLRAERRLRNYELAAPLPFNTASVADLAVPTAANDYLVLTTRRNATASVGGETVVRSVVTEAFYGGDGGALDAGSTLDGEFRVDDTDPRDYLIENTHQQGTVVATDYLCAPGTLYARTLEAEIAPGMKLGLPSSTMDASGVRTAYEYDGQGRMTKITPPGTGSIPQSYAYKVHTADGMNSVAISRGANGRDLTYVYDPLGRLLSATETGAGGTATTAYSYSVSGRLQTETTPDNTTIKHTYDPLGREIQTKDAAGKITQNAYCGVRTLVTKIKEIASDTANEAQFSKRFDAFGRLTEASDNIARAEYAYDAGSNLIRVSMNPFGDRSALKRQVREFDYDGRGVVFLSRHPELTEAGGTAQVRIRTTVDARGHATVTTAEWSEPAGRPSLAHLRLRFGYDAAERLRSVARPAGQSEVQLKTFSYYENGDRFGKRNQLATSTRYNYFPDPVKTGGTTSIAVTTSNTYEECDSSAGCTGLLSGQTITAHAAKADGGTQTILTTTTGYGYDGRNNLTRIGYPRLSNPSVGPERNIHFGYQMDDLVSIANGAPLGAGGTRLLSATYHRSRLPYVLTYAHDNAKDTYDPDPSGLPRPKEIHWSWSGGGMSSGKYVYDGAGNVSAIGGDTYRYDAALRLVQATVSSQTQTYAYDPFGNAQRPGATPDLKSNRLVGSGIAYDESGNMKGLPGLTMSYDVFNSMTHAEGASFGRVFVYDSADERVAVIDYKPVRRELWTIRDLGKRVIREFERTVPASGAPVWTWKKDYVHRGSTLNSTFSPAGLRSVHTDHMGSIRYLTDHEGKLVLGPGATTTGNKFWPFGVLVFPRVLEERPAFTGHERDDDGSSAGAQDLDYMHARYYTPQYGQFLSIDPAATSAKPGVPQSWNRYTYAGNNPVKFLDPDGREKTIYFVQMDFAPEEQAAYRSYGQTFFGFRERVQELAGDKADGYTFKQVTHRRFRYLSDIRKADSTDIFVLHGHASPGYMRSHFHDGEKQWLTNVIIRSSLMRDKTPPKHIVLVGCNTASMAEYISKTTYTTAYGTEGFVWNDKSVSAGAAVVAAIIRGESPAAAADAGTRSQQGFLSWLPYRGAPFRAYEPVRHPNEKWWPW